MGGAADELKQKLSQQIDVATRKLESLKRDLTELHGGDMAALKARRRDLRGRVDAQSLRADLVESRIAGWRDERPGKAVDAISSWEQRLEIEKLLAHARRAEDFALDTLNVAAHEFEEAEQAVLEALAARIEADQALAPA
jgi:chromosome segregation ATPase